MAMRLNRNIRLVLCFVFLSAVIVRCSDQFLFNLGNLSAVSRMLSHRERDLIENLPQTDYVSGVAAFRQQDYENAIHHLSQVPSGGQGLANWFLVQALNESGHWERSLDTIDLDVAAERVLYVNILFEHRDQMSPQEQEARMKIVKHYPDTILIYAHHLLSADQFLEAAGWARQVPDYEQNFGARLMVGRCYYYSGRLAEAESVFHSLYLEHQGVDVLYWYGKTLLKNQKQEQGIHIMEEAVKVAKGGYTSRYLLADLGVYYAKVGRCSDAQSLIERGLQWSNAPSYIQSVEATQGRIESLCITQN